MMFTKAVFASAVFAIGVALATGSDLVLGQDVVQIASSLDGLSGLGAKAVDAASATSDNNFIDFCKGQTLTNGLQITTGSCNGIVMGKIPSKANMVSCIITKPTTGEQIPSGQDFSVFVQISNLQAGSFTNADTTYYAAPQDLNDQGIIIGHTHVTIQDLGSSLNPSNPPDPTQFAFFKGVDNVENAQGAVNVTVVGGLPPGNYRVCTLSAAANHQPVIMPVAQRGAQDDCTKFIVTGNSNTLNEGANNGSGGIVAAALAQSAVDLGPGAIITAAGAGAATPTPANGTSSDQGNNAADPAPTPVDAKPDHQVDKLAHPLLTPADAKSNDKGNKAAIQSSRLVNVKTADQRNKTAEPAPTSISAQTDGQDNKAVDPTSTEKLTGDQATAAVTVDKTQDHKGRLHHHKGQHGQKGASRK